MLKGMIHFMAIAVLAGLFSHSQILAKSGPSLQIDEPDFDFGTMYRGKRVSHRFVIRNSGDEMLKINNVRSSCGCTVPTLDKRELKPGESTELVAVFDSGRFRGQVTKNIYLYSNDPTEAIKKLSIHSFIKQDLMVEPSTIYFADLKEGESVQREIEIRNLSEEPVNIKEIASTVSEVEIQLEKTSLEPDESTVLHLRIPKVDKGIKLTGELTIFNTSHEEALVVRLYGGLVQ